MYLFNYVAVFLKLFQKDILNISLSAMYPSFYQLLRIVHQASHFTENVYLITII